MYKVKNKPTATLLHREPSEEGFSIEEKIRKALTQGEPIEETAEMIYTDRKNGVLPEYDIRTDRQELALDATEKFTGSERARTEENIADQMEAAKDNVNEPIKTPEE